MINYTIEIKSEFEEANIITLNNKSFRKRNFRGRNLTAWLNHTSTFVKFRLFYIKFITVKIYSMYTLVTPHFCASTARSGT